VVKRRGDDGRAKRGCTPTKIPSSVYAFGLRRCFAGKGSAIAITPSCGKRKAFFGVSASFSPRWSCFSIRLNFRVPGSAL
jgi:hypothetical protein